MTSKKTKKVTATTGIDTLRSATLGSDPKFDFVEVKTGGVTFQVRQPSMIARSNLGKTCNYELPDGTYGVDMVVLLVKAIILCTYDPATGKPVFKDTDFDALAGRPPGGFMDDLGVAALKLINVDLEDVRKKD